MMSRSVNRDRARRLPRAALLVTAALAGSGVAVIAGMAAASSFTLRVAKNVHVTNTPTKAFRVKAVDVREAVAVGPSGYAVYTFQGETTHHIICKKTSNSATNCWAFWPPVSVTSAKGISKQAGIKGTLGTFHNHGVLQLTLNGQPLYYFTPDIQSKNKGVATGEELRTFGSIWHIVTAGPSASRGATSTEPTTTTTTTTTSTTPYTTTTSTTPYARG
jgi:predicted lipoprotein with Yx(FWY)xxD motif